MNALLAIAMKDVKLLLRDRMGAFFTFAFPLIMSIFFGMMFSGGGAGVNSIPVVALDLDRTPGSASFLKDIKDGGDIKLEIQQLLAPDPAKPGEFVEATGTVKADVAATREHVLNDVRRGDAAACIILPKGFGEARSAPFSGKRMEIQVAVDPSRQATSGMLTGILTKYGFMQLQAGFTDPQKMRTMAKDSLDRIRSDPSVTPERRQVFDRFFGNLDTMLDSMPTDNTPAIADPAKPNTPNTTAASAWQPITITPINIEREQRGPKNSYETSFPQGIMWGVIGCTLSFAISFVTERSRGTMTRLRAAPLSAWQILGGKAFAAFSVTILMAVALILIGVLIFKVHPRSYAMIASAILATAFCFSGVVMLIASFCHSERAASGMGWGVLMLCSMVGGGMIPLEFLPEWIMPVSNFSPIRWSIYAMQGGIWRPLEWHDMLLPLGILVGLGIFGFGVGLKVFGNSESA